MIPRSLYVWIGKILPKTSAVSLFMLASVPLQAGQSPYVITDVGTFGGSQSAANGINNLGQIVGSANLYGSPLTNHAFLYQGGVMTDLGTLGDYINVLGPVSSSAAYSINNSGQIVGWSYTSSGAIHAFLYDEGTMTDLGTLPGDQQSKARWINDNGQIVGWTVPAGPQHAFLYDIPSATMSDLGTLGGTASFAYGINKNGLIVGDSWTNTSMSSDLAFVYSNGVMATLGRLSNQPAIQALAVNDAGQIVGSAGSSTVTRGFLYSGGTMTDLGNLGGAVTNIQPNAINNKGQIVGVASTPQETGRAFLYSGGVMTDLNNLIDPALGWTLLIANGINYNGQIVGNGKSPSGFTHGFLLTPRPSLNNPRWVAGHAQFDLAGMTGVTYRVEYALSLPGTNWLLLTNLSMAASPTRVADGTTTSIGSRFYRAVQE
jgi:probable HAF family extracellular repeat protein